MKCKHKDWSIHDNNRKGYGYCLKCNREVCLCILITNTMERGLRIIEKLERYHRNLTFKVGE